MISAGEVGAVFSIKDDASAVLQRLADQFNQLQGTVDRVKESMASIASEEEGPLSKLKAQMKELGDSGMNTSRVIEEAFGKVDGAVDGAISRVNALKESFASAAREAEAIRFAPGSGGGGEGGHGGGIMRQLEHEGGGVGRFTSNVIGGPAGAAIGGAMVGYEWFKEAGTVAQAENNLRLAGVDDAGVKKANEEAGNFAQLGMSKLEALNAIRATMGPLNVAGGTDTGIDAATELLPTMAKFAQLARVMKGEGAGDASGQMYELIKGGELRNKLSPDDMGKFIEDYAKVYEGTGGKVDPKTFYQGLKYAKSAGGFFSDEFVNNYLPGIEAEEGGSTAGTMLMTSASAFLGQRFKKPALGELRQMGIYDEHDELKNKDSMVQNPFEWMQSTFIPALKQAGFATPDQQIEEVEKLTSRNSAEAAALLGIRPGNVERTAAAIKRSDTLNDATTKIGDNDPLAAMAKVEAGMANLASAFGGPFIPSITGGLSNLATALNWTASLTKPHLLPDGKPEMLDTVKPWSPFNGTSAGPMTPEEMSNYVPPAAMPHRPTSQGTLIPNEPSIAARSAALASPPVNVTVQPQLTSTPVPISVTVQNNVTAAMQTVETKIMAEIKGMIGGLAAAVSGAAMNSAAGHDGRAAPTPVDGGAFMGP